MLQIISRGSAELLEAEELSSRAVQWAEHQQRDAWQRQLTDYYQATRLQTNFSETYALESEERLDREDVELLCQQGYEVAQAVILLRRQAEHNARVMQGRLQEHCVTVFRPNILWDADADAAAAAADLQKGRDDLRRQREVAAHQAEKRQQDVLHRQKLAESFRTAQVFVTAQEVRDRTDVSHELDRAVKKLLSAFKQSEREAKELEQLSFQNSDEQKLLIAEREKKLLEEKQTLSKREAEFKKEQHRLVNKCIHSRTGGSVFVGPQARKVCLICRVKFDDALGIFVRMT